MLEGSWSNSGEMLKKEERLKKLLGIYTGTLDRMANTGAGIGSVEAMLGAGLGEMTARTMVVTKELEAEDIVAFMMKNEKWE